MKTITSIAFLLIVLLSACNDTDSKREIIDFSKIEEFTPDDLAMRSLPPTHFKISYPEDDYDIMFSTMDYIGNTNYCEVDRYKEYKTSEILLVDVSNTWNKNNDSQKKELNNFVENFKENLAYASVDFKITFNGREKFDGKKRNIIKFTYTIQDSDCITIPGEYLGLSVIEIPDNKDNNGVILTLSVNKKEAGIQNYDEIFKKSDIGKIFYTFRFVD